MPIPVIVAEAGWMLLAKVFNLVVDIAIEKFEDHEPSGTDKKSRVMAQVKILFNEHNIPVNSIDNVSELVEGVYQIAKRYNCFELGPSLLTFVIEKIWNQELSGMFIEGSDKKAQVLVHVNGFLEENNVTFHRTEELVDDIVCLLNKHRIFQKRGM